MATTIDKPLATLRKDPDAKRTFEIDWESIFPTDALSGASCSWSVPAGLTEHSGSVSGQVHGVQISGGTAGEKYRITSHVVTASGETDKRSIVIWVIQR